MNHLSCSPHRPLMVCQLLMAALALATPLCHAQMVPEPEHVLHSLTSGSPDKGLSVAQSKFWPHWEGRIGVTLDRAADPLKDSYVLVSPRLSGNLSLRSAHVLSDYYFSNGFRATAGLLRGSVTQSSWADGDANSPLNLSLHRLDTLSLATAGNRTTSEGEIRTLPYVGAGYSARLTPVGAANPWRFNADFGIISINNNNIGRLSRVLTGEDSVSSLTKELRLRPLFKVSVRHAF